MLNLNGMVLNMLCTEKMQGAMRLSKWSNHLVQNTRERGHLRSGLILTLTILLQLLDYEARSGREIIVGHWFCSCGLLTDGTHREIVKKKNLSLWEEIYDITHVSSSLDECSILFYRTNLFFKNVYRWLKTRTILYC